ncbi:MAG: PadR family transcriptional regulator, partial [Pseudomonadota bacterium]
AKINKARYAILGMLALLESASGYDMKKKMANSTDHFWKESDGALYPTLKQLSDEGLLTCKIDNVASGKPKKMYTITEDGMSELLEWMAEDFELATVRNELVLKIFFGSLVDKKISIHHLKEFRYRNEKFLARYRGDMARIENSKNKDIYHYLTMRAGVMIKETFIRWCDESLKLLDS